MKNKNDMSKMIIFMSKKKLICFSKSGVPPNSVLFGGTVPPNILEMPASCSFKACVSQKELCERNNTEFTCIHIEEIKASDAAEPEEELLLEDCSFIISHYLDGCCYFGQN